MSDATPARRLPKRDFLLIPLISLLTVIVMLAGAEVTARAVWPEEKGDTCMVRDPLVRARPRANCVSRMKAAEGPWVENRYNACGYRSGGDCTARPPKSPRLVVMGASTSWGYLVPYGQTWSTRAAQALSARCGAPVDVQSLSGYPNLNEDALRVPEAVALDPRLVVLVVTPFDLMEAPEGGFNPIPVKPAARPQAGAAKPQGIAAIRGLLASSRAMFMAQHYLFQNGPVYVSMYLRYGDKAAFLRPPFTPAWQARLAYVDGAVGFISGKLAAAHVPFAVMYVPQQAQATLTATGQAPPGVVPTALSQAIGDIARRHGAGFIDVNAQFRGVKDPEAYFYNADGHPNAHGHELIARAAAAAMGQPGGQASICTPREGSL